MEASSSIVIDEVTGYDSLKPEGLLISVIAKLKEARDPQYYGWEGFYWWGNSIAALLNFKVLVGG